MGANQEEQVPQSSAKREREEAEDTEDADASVNRPQKGAPTVEDPSQ